MNTKLLTDSKISFETADTRHIGLTKFAFATVTIAPDVFTKFFWRELIKLCPVCGATGGGVCLWLSTTYRSSEHGCELAMGHQSCFDSLRNLTPDLRQRMQIYSARFRAQFEIKRQITPPSPRNF